jgi:ABC-type sugar transport system ATPase subunit
LALRATVEAVEPLGAETHVHLTSGSQSFIVRTDSNTRQAIGEQVIAAVAAEHLRFFDVATEAAIL